jgi:hypothetical protein
MRASIRSFLYLAIGWLLLVAATAYLFYPAVGEIVANISPNPFWSVDATGNPLAPFSVILKTRNWLLLCLGPIAAVAALMAMSWFTQRRKVSSAG